MSGTHAALKMRSAAWFAAEGRAGLIYRSWLRAEGFTPAVFDGRPVIGIANSWSELTPGNAHLRDAAEAVKGHVDMSG
jgi:dihydroxyacid dehydratase/phosphogluconate dehydratase